jgi:hypothetical protein
MSRLGGTRCTSDTCAPSTGTTRGAEDYDELPYFWSDQYDVKLQMLGLPTYYDAVEIVEGDPDAWEFVAAYGRGGHTIAVLGTVSGRVDAYREAIEKRAEFPPPRPD